MRSALCSLPALLRRRAAPRAVLGGYALVAALAVLAAVPARGLPAAPAGGLLDMPAVLAAAAAVDRERFPNADDVLIDDMILCEYQADGTAVTLDDTCIKVLTEKGRRDQQVLTRHFTLPFGTASFLLVQVIKPDGRVIAVDLEAQSRVMVDPSQMQSNIYNPDSKVLQVTLPELSPGDLVRYVAREDLVKPRVPGTFSDYQILEYTSPILRYTYEVRAPRELPLRSVAVKAEIPGTLEHTRHDTADRLVYRWAVRDVAQMYSEPRMPPLYTVVQRLLVSTIPDWEYLSRWYWQLSEPHLRTTPAMQAKVSELIAGLTDREARLRAIFRFVSQQIRYMGITVEKEAPGYEPHDVALTFENRHGVCRDKAALLVAMLRLADITAFPVLIHNGPRKDAEVPQPFFNHAIAAALAEDGSVVLMDPTDENTKDLFPAYLGNQSYLVARPEGDVLRTSPITPASANLVQVRTEARLDAAGALRGQSALRFDGINDNAYRGYFASVSPEERRRFFEGAVKRLAAGARLTAFSILPADLRNTEEPLEVTLGFEAEAVPVSDGTTHLIPLPRLGTAIGMVNFILRDAGLKERRFPFLTEYACGVSEEFRLELDAALGEPAALPTFEAMDTPTLHWDLALDWSGRTLTGKGLFTIDTPEVSPAAYLEMKESLKTLEIQGRKQPIFRKTAEAWAGADSVVLERVTEIELKDATHWSRLDRVRRRILTYKGKKDHAELSWQYNPSWETVEVVRAAVTAADGTVKAISPEEINTMDASWVASAPRYPAGRTLVASLPGVEVGCTLEVEVRSTAAGGPFFATRHRFGGFDPAQRQVLRLRAPAGLSVRVGEVHGGLLAPDGDTIQSTHRRQGDLVETEWTVLDQPAVVREDGLPPLECLVPTVLISAGDWKDYARELRRAMDRAAEGGLEVRLLAGKARERHRDPAALVQALRDLVVTRVRAAGPSLPELPTAAISAADVTLRDGYGNSADVAVLLGALLRAAGLRPEWALAAAVPPVPVCEAAARQYPDPGLFPAVLVRVKVPGLGVVYLNDTHQYAALGSTPHDGRLGLALRRGRLERIEALEGSRDAEEVEYVIGLDAAGDAEVTYRRQSRGGLYAAENRRFSEMPPEERRRYFEEAIAGLSQSAEARSELLTDFTAQPGQEGFSAWVRAMAVRDGDYLALSLPRSLRQLMGLRADTRREPLFWSAPRRLRLAFEVVLPPEFNEVVLKPQEMVWEAPEQAGTVRTTVTRSEPGRLQVVHEVDLRPAILPAAAYPELLETHRRLSHPAAATLLLRRQPAAAAP